MKLILGSSSPRRREILEFFSVPFETANPPFDESTVPFTGDPKAYVLTVALEKAHSLKAHYPHDTIVTADTMIYFEGQVIGKPKDEDDMRAMLGKLSGRWHSVYTSVVVVSPHMTLSDVEETRVLCNTLSPEMIHNYMKKHSLHDKAGSYAIQKSGSLLVKEIQGCYYNVMGLPINTLTKLLQPCGIDLWSHLKRF